MVALSGLVFGLLFIVGVIIVGAGIVGINNRRFAPGGIFLLLGLLLVIWSGQGLHTRFFQSDLDKQMVRTADELGRAKSERGSVQKMKSGIERQRQDLLREIKARRDATQPLETQIAANEELRGMVERTVVLNRWHAECDSALLGLDETVKNLELSLTYLRLISSTSNIPEAVLGKAKAIAQVKDLQDKAATPPGGSVPLPLSEDEIKEVANLVAAEE